MISISSLYRVYRIHIVLSGNHVSTIVKIMRSLHIIWACLLLMIITGFARSQDRSSGEEQEAVEEEAVETPTEVEARLASVTPTEARNILLGMLGRHIDEELVGCANEWQSLELLNGFSQITCDEFVGGEGAISGVTIVIYEGLVVTISLDRIFSDSATANTLFNMLAVELAGDCALQVEMANEILYMCVSYGYFVDIFWVPGYVNNTPASRFVLTFMLDPGLQALYNQSIAPDGAITDPI